MGSTTCIRRSTPPRSPEWYFFKRQDRRARIHGHEGWPFRVEQIGHREHLVHAAKILQREGGQAPGIDQVSWADLSPSEVGWICGDFSKMVLNGIYRPAATRAAPIPKPGSDGRRILQIGTIGDRIVGKALHITFQPYWEKRFSPRSHGYRPRRNTWRMLAELEVAMLKTGRRVLAVDDIRNAFDNVPIAKLVELHRRALASVEQGGFTDADRDRTMRLITAVLQGHDPGRSRGIDQGAPFSPIALNTLLDEYHDQKVVDEIESDLLWFRFADNVAYLCRGMTEGEQVLKRVGRMLEPLGLRLKGHDGVKDLGHGDATLLLGFSLRWHDGRLHLGLAPSSLDSLHQHLGQACERPNPPLAAREAVLGWVEAFAPALENGEVANALAIASEHGYREVSRAIAEDQWRKAWERWQACRARAVRRFRSL